MVTLRFLPDFRRGLDFVLHFGTSVLRLSVHLRALVWPLGAHLEPGSALARVHLCGGNLTGNKLVSYPLS